MHEAIQCLDRGCFLVSHRVSWLVQQPAWLVQRVFKSRRQLALLTLVAILRNGYHYDIVERSTLPPYHFHDREQQKDSSNKQHTVKLNINDLFAAPTGRNNKTSKWYRVPHAVEGCFQRDSVADFPFQHVPDASGKIKSPYKPS